MSRSTSCWVLPRESACTEWDDSQEHEAVDRITIDVKKRFQDAERVKAKQTMRIKNLMKTKQIIICDSFSDDNCDVNVSSCKRSVKYNGVYGDGFCFLNHPKIEKNQILKWSLRVPKFEYGFIGMVIILE